MTALDGIWLARPERPEPGTPVAVKDLLDTAGLVTTYGSILFAEHVPAQQRRGGAAAGGGRLRRRGQDEPARVRVRHLVAEPALRHRAEPARAGPPRRRLERRLRGGDRGRRRRARPRHGLGRIDPDPRRLVRHRRVQADVRPRPGGRLLPARAELRPRRADGVDGGGLRRADAGARPRLRAGRARVAGGGRGRHRVARPRGPARARARRGRGGAVPAQAHDRLPARRRREPAVHARGGRRPPRPLPGERRRVRRQRPRQAGALLRGDGRRGRGRAARTRRVPRALRGRAGRRRSAADADGRLRRSAGRRGRAVHPPGRDPVHVPVRLAGLARARAPLRRRGGRFARLRPARGPIGRRCA